MLSIPLGLPKFKVIKQELHSYGYAIHVEKTETQERCPHCGFATSAVHPCLLKDSLLLSVPRSFQLKNILYPKYSV
ncbi:hypothetical protein CA592_04445 [Anoxybacillus flavithermus]|nr:hypothetical protein CA592_04445 [Anoxybacillus flavithermus]